MRTQQILALQLCDLETVLTIERARAEEAEKAAARAERRLKQAIKEEVVRCISHMSAVSHSLRQHYKTLWCMSFLQLRTALCYQEQVTCMLSVSFKSSIQGLK